MSSNLFKNPKGFTLIETLVGVAVFILIATASYRAYVSLFTLINQNQYKIIALNLANEQFEIIRNLSYSDVGIPGGIPNGKIPHDQTLVRSGITFDVTTTIRNIDLPFDGLATSTSPKDLSPADNKSVEVEVNCPGCASFTPIVLTTTVAPKSLETSSTNGALFIKVFDANGIAVPGADVHISNPTASPAITIDDVTDNNGLLQIIDAPPGVGAYQITVTKDGYSTDRTYPTGGVGNPSPSKPHATVVVQQLTQVSFSIDHLSQISISSKDAFCAPVGNIDFSMVGSKQIGTNVPKYSQSLATDVSGAYSNSSLEWDTYSLTGIDSTYDIVGINPLNAVAVNPGAEHDVDIIVAPKDPRSLLVTVKDSATLLPVTDAVVTVTNASSYNQSRTTDRGFVNQTDWSGGGGQALSTDMTQYFADDGFLEMNGPAGELKLKNVGTYNPSGILESSTFDTGSASNFHTLTWSPTDQPPLTGAGSVKFQIATNSELTATTTWTYLGPDGTASSYYTSPNSTIATVHNGKRYLRYKAFLSTADTSATPNISDIAFTMTSDCTPPGQVVFSGLGSGSYHISVSKSGYITAEADVTMDADWKEQEIILSQ